MIKTNYWCSFSDFWATTFLREGLQLSQCYSQPKNGFPFHSRSAQETLLPSNTCVLLCAPKNIGPQANCKLVSRTWVWFKLQGTTENVDTSVKKLPPRSVSNYLSIYLQGFQCFHFPLRKNTAPRRCSAGSATHRAGPLGSPASSDGFAQKVLDFCSHLLSNVPIWSNLHGEMVSLLKHQLGFHCILW